MQNYISEHNKDDVLEIKKLLKKSNVESLAEFYTIDDYQNSMYYLGKSKLPEGMLEKINLLDSMSVQYIFFKDL